MPPVYALFPHRKVGGLYLLAPKLKARVTKCVMATEDAICIHASVEVRISAAEASGARRRDGWKPGRAETRSGSVHDSRPQRGTSKNYLSGYRYMAFNIRCRF